MSSAFHGFDSRRKHLSLQSVVFGGTLHLATLVIKSSIEQLSNGVLEQWNDGKMEQWNHGGWNNGILEQWV